MCICIYIYIYSSKFSCANIKYLHTWPNDPNVTRTLPLLPQPLPLPRLSPRLCLSCPVFVDPVELTAEVFHLHMVGLGGPLVKDFRCQAIAWSDYQFHLAFSWIARFISRSSSSKSGPKRLRKTRREAGLMKFPMFCHSTIPGSSSKNHRSKVMCLQVWIMTISKSCIYSQFLTFRETWHRFRISNAHMTPAHFPRLWPQLRVVGLAAEALLVLLQGRWSVPGICWIYE